MGQRPMEMCRHLWTRGNLRLHLLPSANLPFIFVTHLFSAFCCKLCVSSKVIKLSRDVHYTR
jgi:hypothetical protein